MGRSREIHGASGNIGIDLHEQRALFGNAAGADDPPDWDAKLVQALDDGACTEGGGFDKSTVDFRATGLEGRAEEEAREQRVDEDGSIPVMPIESKKAMLPWKLGGGFRF